MEASSARRETDAESNRGDDHDTHGVFFRSAWTDLVKDPLKRASLRALFRPTPQVEEAPPGAESSRAQSVASESRGSEVPTEILAQDHNSDGGEELEVEFATDPETDEILSRLQLETNQEMPCVVHALYYCNGNTDMAREFLKGASPAGMWSPDDDLLLVNLVAEENIDRSGVDAAVVRGDFATMRLHRDTDAILHRIQFLR
ncbi:hypothetical protein ON010_g4114 [Phytophthora cinnamomi]|nr:hypothetical protein ON010_g4114 [Phytophthora cinnamomi]